MDGQQYEIDVQDDFFHFSESLSAHAGVSKALNYLHHNGLNETLACYFVWHAAKGYGRIAKQEYQLLHDTIKLWNDEVTEELTRVRDRVLKHSHEKLTVIKSWLQEEVNYSVYVERSMIVSAISRKQCVEQVSERKCLDACYNVARYFQHQKISYFSSVEKNIMTVIKAVFRDQLPDLIAQELHKVFGKIGGYDGDFCQLPLDSVD